MTHPSPTVSILIPAYNTTYFRQTLASALAQDFGDLEVVVCDDSPGTEIESICNQFSDPRLVYKRNPQNLGFHGNFANCFNVARGAFIKFLNDDDVLMPDCVSQMVRYLQNPGDGITLVTSKRTLIGEQGEVLPDVQATVALSQTDGVINGFDLGNLVLMDSVNYIGEPTTAMFRKADLTVDPSGLFDFQGHRYTIFADVILWIRLLAKGNCAYIAKPLSQFRVHRGQEQAKSSNAAGVVVERFNILESARSLGFLKDKAQLDKAKKTLLGILDMALKAPVFGAADKARFTQMKQSLTDAPRPAPVQQFSMGSMTFSGMGGPKTTISYGFNLKGSAGPATGQAKPSQPMGSPVAAPAVTLDDAVALHKQGRLQEAEPRYLQLLETQPNNADALQYLGMLYLQQGRVADGVVRIKAALDIDPNHFAALSNLANVLMDEGDHQGALSLLQRASKLRADNPVIWYGLGRAHVALDQTQEAVEALKQTVALKPDFSEALSLLAKAYLSLGEIDQAEPLAQKALAAHPNDPLLHYACGVAAKARGDQVTALTHVDRALQADPQLAQAWCLKGELEALRGQAENALAAYQRGLELNPEQLDAAMAAATLCINSYQYPQALKWLDHVLARQPQHVVALAEKGQLLVACARPQEARALLQQANDQLGNLLSMQFRHAIAGIPRLRYRHDRLDELRERLSQEFKVLEARIQTEPVTDDSIGVVGEVQPFYLAYHERNNRPLLAEYGDLCCDLMSKWAGQRSDLAPDSIRPPTPGKRRIGIFSAHVQEQSVWRAIVRGWVCELDRQQFELVIFYPDVKVDQQTQLAKESVDQFHQGQKTLPEWIRCIKQANVDVLIYPELGMDALTVRLASLRLAPVQMSSWGHPETTGLSTIDYYLSADLFEAPQAQDYYSEKLVRLPNLGCCFESLPAKPEHLDLSQFGISADATVFVCPGTPFKYMPEYDEALVKIAQQVPNAQFVFLSFAPFAPLPELLMQRLRQTFEEAGLSPGRYLCLIPWQTRSGFYGLLKQAHAFLDTIGFSGFNTVMHAIDCETPIVTIEGQFMRGRFGSAILRRIGMGEHVCQNANEYVDLAVQLATDASLRQRMSQQIMAGRALLYGDKAPIRTLEKVLLDSNSI